MSDDVLARAVGIARIIAHALHELGWMEEPLPEHIIMAMAKEPIASALTAYGNAKLEEAAGIADEWRNYGTAAAIRAAKASEDPRP